MTHNPFSIVRDFEDAVKEYTGAPYAVAVDSCTSALFLSLKYQYKLFKAKEQRECGEFHIRELFPKLPVIKLPKRTHISVPSEVIHAGLPIEFRSLLWEGTYQLFPLPVWDAALRLRTGMFSEIREKQRHIVQTLHGQFDPTCFVCLSFQYRKHLPIGRGGMILHDDPVADKWFRRARFFGRDEVPMAEDPGPTIVGWKKYMTPDDAARGLCFMQNIQNYPPDLKIEYPDLSTYKIFDKHCPRPLPDKLG